MPDLLRQTAASSLNGCLCASGGSNALQHEGLGDFATNHDLGALGNTRYQLRGTQHSEVDITGR